MFKRSKQADKPVNTGDMWKAIRMLRSQMNDVQVEMDALRKQASRAERKAYRDVAKADSETENSPSYFDLNTPRMLSPEEMAIFSGGDGKRAV